MCRTEQENPPAMDGIFFFAEFESGLFSTNCALSAIIHNKSSFLEIYSPFVAMRIAKIFFHKGQILMKEKSDA